MYKKKTRRSFLRDCGCAVGGAVFASSVRDFGIVNALAQVKGQAKDTAPDYKALVCIFLFGGHDGNNLVIPYDGYAAYAAYRPTATGGIGIPQSSLLQITAPSHGSQTFGFHPNLVEMQTLYNQQKLAVLCNTGTLVQPMTRTQYLNGSVPRPENLFSHEDQANQSQSTTSLNTLLNPPTGWGGRLAENIGSLNPPGAVYPVVTSMAGSTLFSTGNSSRPIVPVSGGLLGFTNPRANDPRFQSLQYLLTLDRNGSGPTLIDRASDITEDAIRNVDVLNQALANSTAFVNGSGQTVTFPNTSIGRQLRDIAKVIRDRALFGLQRQVFFASQGGYDTHTNQITAHTSLFAQLSQAMKAFYDATDGLTLAAQVTTFTMSDFSRTLLPTDSGTDHAWGNHLLVMGGAVNGGNFYGTYPTLATGTGDDTGNQGRWIPTTSVDQYSATLAHWFGLDPALRATVFPSIGNFSTQVLGFMS